MDATAMMRVEAVLAEKDARIRELEAELLAAIKAPDQTG